MKVLLLFSTLIILVCPSCVAYDCVPNKPPIVSFTYSPSNPHICESIFFNASASYDPDGSIASYTWCFDDGNITIIFDDIINHHYEMPGVYNVTLTVVDSSGAKRSTWIEIAVTKRPFAAFTYSPIQTQVNELVTFDASQSEPDGGYIVSYEWDFGDDNVTILTHPVITHIYSTFGLYTVTLTITDSENESAIASDTIRVWAYPHADFTLEPLVLHAGVNAKFDASTSTPNGGYIVSYEWDFSDSIGTSGIIVTHNYTEAGNYTITLNVTDSEGKWDTESKDIEVLPQREDLNEDGKVNIVDLAMLCKAYGSYPGHPRWNPKADIMPDGMISVLDAVRIAKAFNP